METVNVRNILLSTFEFKPLSKLRDFVIVKTGVNRISFSLIEVCLKVLTFII